MRPVHRNTKRPSFCCTWCIKVMQKHVGEPLTDSTSTNKRQNAFLESQKQTRNLSATSARGARAKSGAHRCAWSANPAVALAFLLVCVCVCVTPCMVRRNHVKTDWWTHYPFDLYNKTCNSKTVVIHCVSTSCKERLVDT